MTDYLGPKNMGEMSKDELGGHLKERWQEAYDWVTKNGNGAMVELLVEAARSNGDQLSILVRNPTFAIAAGNLIDLALTQIVYNDMFQSPKKDT
jgi:hypothetical protein